jgi:aminomethyltransferase
MEENLKSLVLHQKHIELGGRMVPFAGYQMPIQYSGVVEEHMRVREAVGIFDVSHMGEFYIQGEGSLELIQKISSNDASKLDIGKAQYSCMPNDNGGIVDDLIIYKMSEDGYMLVVNASNIEKDWNWISECNTRNVQMQNQSDKMCLFAIQGPKAISTLQRITDFDLSAVEYYSFVVGEIGGIKNVIISATGYTGSGGFELYVDNANALELWEAVMDSGKEEGILPIGLGARDTLRLEKGFCLYGNDIDDSTSPLEAGLGWITKFTKDFINSDALKKQKEEGVKRRLVGFVMTERGIPRSGYEILSVDGTVIGTVTSGGQSPILEKGIGMGYVPKEYSKKGTAIKIQIRKKQVTAEVVKVPFV